MKFTRPPAVRAIALGYILSPLGNVLQAAVASGDSTDAVLGKALTGFGMLGTFLVVAGPIAGIGIYSGQRWGFVAFFVHAFALLIDSAMRLSHGSFAYKATILLVDLAVLVAISLVLQEDIRAPFLSEEDRGWRLGKRIAVKGAATVNFGGTAAEVSLVNISPTGLLVAIAGELPALGVTGTVAFAGNAGGYAVRVVRHAEGQVALAFADANPESLEETMHKLVRAH